MGSPCAITVYCSCSQQNQSFIELCISRLAQLEDKYSRFKSESLLSQINHSAGNGQTFDLDDEFWALLVYADTAHTISNGLFDITSGVLRKVWDFKLQQIPLLTDISKALELVGWSKIPLDQHKFCLPIPGMEIDLGGIVKEYAADLLVNLARANNLTHGLIDLGGDVAVVGPHPDNSPWQVAISHPQDPSRAIATIPLSSGGLASSGDYQRFIMIDGVKYCHILDPTTGWPVKGFAAVSVWAPQCVIAGTLATTAMLKGDTDGAAWLSEIGCQYLTIDKYMRSKISTL
jgi:thiamine biosynthesis lipoprotein